MICIYCLGSKTDVINSRSHKKNSEVWRRRRCATCGKIFTTTETPRLELKVEKPDGVISVYSKALLSASITKAVMTAGLKPNDVYWLLKTIENQLITYQAKLANKPVSVQSLKEIIYKVLSAYHPSLGMAYGSRYGLLPLPKRRLKPPKGPK